MTMSRTITGLARRLAAVLAECNDAQRRKTILMTSPDTYRAGRDMVPDDYAEFLFRTSGALIREPSAGRRSARLVG